MTAPSSSSAVIRRGTLAALAAAMTAILVACEAGQRTPASPTPAPAADANAISEQAHENHNSAADGDKGFIDGWHEGRLVQLYYTKSFFCAEPPDSSASTNCEVGAAPEVEPRPGSIPTIYAVAPFQLQVDPTTLSCRAGTPCLNHPAMIDLSRIVGPRGANAPAAAHSHILS